MAGYNVASAGGRALSGRHQVAGHCVVGTRWQALGGRAWCDMHHMAGHGVTGTSTGHCVAGTRWKRIVWQIPGGRALCDRHQVAGHSVAGIMVWQTCLPSCRHLVAGSTRVETLAGTLHVCYLGSIFPLVKKSVFVLPSAFVLGSSASCFPAS